MSLAKIRGLISKETVVLRCWRCGNNSLVLAHPRQSESDSEEVLTFETSAFECLHGRQITLRPQFTKPTKFA